MDSSAGAGGAGSLVNSKLGKSLDGHAQAGAAWSVALISGFLGLHSQNSEHDRASSIDA